MRTKLSTPSQAIADLFVRENPGTIEVYSNGRTNLSNTSFSVKVVDIANVLGLETHSAEDIWDALAPLVEVHSRVMLHVDDALIAIMPAKIPVQVRLRPDTATILIDICRTSGLKKVDVLHQAIRDFHLRLNND